MQNFMNSIDFDLILPIIIKKLAKNTLKFALYANSFAYSAKMLFLTRILVLPII